MPAYPCCCPNHIWCDFSWRDYTHPQGSIVPTNRHEQSAAKNCPDHPTFYGIHHKGYHCEVYPNKWSIMTDHATPSRLVSHETWQYGHTLDINWTNWRDFIDDEMECEEVYMPVGHPRAQWVRPFCWAVSGSRGLIDGGFRGSKTLEYKEYTTVRTRIDLAWRLDCYIVSPYHNATQLVANTPPWGRPERDPPDFPPHYINYPGPNVRSFPAGQVVWLFQAEINASDNQHTVGGVIQPARGLKRRYHYWWEAGDAVTGHGDAVYGMPLGFDRLHLLYDEFNKPYLTPAQKTMWDYDSHTPWRFGAKPGIVPEFSWDYTQPIIPTPVVAAGTLLGEAETNDIQTAYKPTLFGRATGSVVTANIQTAYKPTLFGRATGSVVTANGV